MNVKAVQKICYGMYVISSKKDGKINGQIANTLFQITSDPATVAVSINKQNLTHEYITASKTFAASIISKDAPMTFIGNWGFKSGRDIDKFKDAKYKDRCRHGRSDCPRPCYRISGVRGPEQHRCGDPHDFHREDRRLRSPQ